MNMFRRLILATLVAVSVQLVTPTAVQALNADLGVTIAAGQAITDSNIEWP